LSIKDHPNAVEFMTDKGVTVPAIDTDQMREVDRIAMEETGPNLYQMMENAGRNLATLSIDILGDRWNDANILVMAGLGDLLLLIQVAYSGHHVSLAGWR